MTLNSWLLLPENITNHRLFYCIYLFSTHLYSKITFLGGCYRFKTLLKEAYAILCFGITVLHILYDNSFFKFHFHFLCGTGPVQVVCKIGPFLLYTISFFNSFLSVPLSLPPASQSRCGIRRMKTLLST